jgi:threonine dehydratase
MIEAFRCAACAATVPVAEPWPWRCPNATEADRHHVLFRVPPVVPEPGIVSDPNPFVAFDERMVWAAFAAAHGMGSGERNELVRALDSAVAGVDGAGFTWTPFGRSDELSDALGFDRRGGVWVKDETANVAGSHKARHLVGIVLHLLAAERLGVVPAPAQASVSFRPVLAIASCGNAALAAATLARAVGWPLEVFVPDWADAGIVARLKALGPAITVCVRGAGGPPGDPCVHRFREVVARGAIPFSVQGPENALCLDGGRTIGWELVEQAPEPMDRIFVQVGGGALATCVAQAFADVGQRVRLHAVQAAGCAPLERAWRLSRDLGDTAARHWSACMWPWEDEPRSVADGILDDETYDWLGVVQGMEASGGAPVVAAESTIVEAHELATKATGLPVSATGSAGLAGLLAIRDQVGDDERVAVLFTGRQGSGGGSGPGGR